MKDFNKREWVYIGLILVLLATVMGMKMVPKGDAPEAIVYYAGAANSSEATVRQEGEEQALGSDIDGDEPFITPDSGEVRATVKPAVASSKKSTTKAKATKAPAKMTVNEAQLNINDATAAQLTRLPGVGEATAAKIIDYRDSHGGFKKVEDIMKVSGIGAAKFNGMKDMICVE